MKLKFVCQKFRLMDERYPALGFMAQLKPCITGEPAMAIPLYGDDRFDVETTKVGGKMVLKRTWKDVPATSPMDASENEAALAPAATKLLGILTLHNLAAGSFIAGQEYSITIDIASQLEATTA